MPNESTGSGTPDSISLTVAILDSDEQRRKAAAAALARLENLEITEIPFFPEKAGELAKILPDSYNVVFFNVDCDPDLAFEMAENLSAISRTVMAYSSRADMKLAVHLMRAGAREFFTTPLDAAELAAAMERAPSAMPSRTRIRRRPAAYSCFSEPRAAAAPPRSPPTSRSRWLRNPKVKLF